MSYTTASKRRNIARMVFSGTSTAEAGKKYGLSPAAARYQVLQYIRENYLDLYNSADKDQRKDLPPRLVKFRNFYSEMLAKMDGLKIEDKPEIVLLSAQDQLRLADLLLNPPSPSQALIRAAERTLIAMVAQAIDALWGMIDGGDECKGRDSEISDVIRLLEQGR